MTNYFLVFLVIGLLLIKAIYFQVMPCNVSEIIMQCVSGTTTQRTSPKAIHLFLISKEFATDVTMFKENRLSLKV